MLGMAALHNEKAFMSLTLLYLQLALLLDVHSLLCVSARGRQVKGSDHCKSVCHAKARSADTECCFADDIPSEDMKPCPVVRSLPGVYLHAMSYKAQAISYKEATADRSLVTIAAWLTRCYANVICC